MTVHQVFYAEMIAGGLGTSYTPSTPGNVFCLVDVEFSNLSQGTVKINPLDVVMQDPGSNRYGQGIGLIMGPPPEIQNLGLTDLGAGQKVRGTVLFSVPATEPLSRQVVFTRTSPELAVEIAGQGVHLAGPAAQPGPVTRSGVELTVLEWRTTDKVSSGSWSSSAPEGSILFVVTVRVKNTSRAPTFTMNPLNCLLKDSAGNNYTHSMLALGLANRLTVTELAPGQSAEGAIMYVVPKDASIVEVWYKTGALGGPLAVRLQ
jgi:hypothetical protein